MKDICLLFHCIKEDCSDYSQVNPSLYISVKEMNELLYSLKEMGYSFGLPYEEVNSPKCSITFDDGYKNNELFIPLAEKYEIPFILFLSSLYTQHEVPYIWDLMTFHKRKDWHFFKSDYYKSIDSLTVDDKKALLDDVHRPFSFDELKKLDSNKFFHLASHTHSHQPLYGSFTNTVEEELRKNIDFLSNFDSFLKDEFSFPCGLFNRKVKNSLMKKFDRVYTIEGGSFNGSKKTISRMSLISPKYGGPLLDQIDRQLQMKYKVKRFISKMLM